MAKGLPKWAIKEAKRRGARNIFAYAWTLVKRKGKRRKSTKTRTSNPKKTRKVRRLVRRRGRRRGGKSMTRTAFKLIRLGALVAPAGYVAMQSGKAPEVKFREGILCYTGFNIETGRFHLDWLARGWGPYLGSVATTYGIPKLANIIRSL